MVAVPTAGAVLDRDHGPAGHPDAARIDADLKRLEQGRKQLLRHIEELRRTARDERQEGDIEEAGPMIIWEAAAKRLEKLAE